MKGSSGRVGVCVAVHNGCERTRMCLDAIRQSTWTDRHVVVVDDGSTDDTAAMLRERDDVQVITGDGNMWWTRGNNVAIAACFEAGCDYILMLNPDILIEPDTIEKLMAMSRQRPGSVVAPVVVEHASPDIIAWAGSRWMQIAPLVWSNRYIHKRGTKTHALANEPYSTSEAHGRGVLVPKQIFERIGLYDEQAFPHYGADTDFCFRAQAAGFTVVVDPRIRVRCFTENTGMAHAKSWRGAWRGYWNYLTARKNGEAAKVWWTMTQRHVPWYGAMPTYSFIITLNTFRYWSGLASHEARKVLRRKTNV